jgi:hypothetical protein
MEVLRMTSEDFRNSLAGDRPPSEVGAALSALWWDFKGDWKRAHAQVDDKEDTSSMWVHAYLHRKEGVEWNASYWYQRAGKSFSHLSLEEERKSILNALLEQS